MATFLTIILFIVAIYIVIDIYYRLKNHTSHLAYLLFVSDVINKTLTNKGIVKREELDKAREGVLDNLKRTRPGEYKNYKKILRKRGIDIDK